jgi:hypothetical protein
MNDKELLELAAKAAGIEWPQKISDFSRQYDGVRSWNPLTDDGDALRLAVKLSLSIWRYDTLSTSKPNFTDWQCDERGDDPYAATRRAIVRAAAEIGRTK